MKIITLNIKGMSSFVIGMTLGVSVLLAHPPAVTAITAPADNASGVSENDPQSNFNPPESSAANRHITAQNDGIISNNRELIIAVLILVIVAFGVGGVVLFRKKRKV